MEDIEDIDFQYIKSKINQEGFHYCFLKYSNFEEIKDYKFHELRLKYLESAKELEKYINNKAEEEFYGE